MIESLTFKNFKALRNTTLPLGRFTVIVGPNGSGKSTALQALNILKRGRQTQHPQLASVGVTDSEVELVCKVNFHPNPASNFKITWTPRGIQGDWTRIADGQKLPTAAEAFLTGALQRISIYALDPKQLRLPVPLQPLIELGEQGQNLAAVLDRLRDDTPEGWDALNQELGRLIPEFDRVLFDNPSQGVRAFKLRIRGTGHNIASVDLSNGTLLALAILCLAYLPNPPTLVGLEEPEHGVHPRLLRYLRDILYRLSYPENFGEKRPPVQVVVTTHSPYFLTQFKDHPEEIVIAQKTGTDAQFERLVDRPDIMEILEDAPLGDVWYSGILGGVPAKV